MSDADGTTAHGPIHGYNRRGCRCDDCTRAAQEYRRRDRAAKRARRVLVEGRLVATEAAKHGTESTHSQWGCQCEPCRQVHRLSVAARRAQNRADRPRAVDRPVHVVASVAEGGTFGAAVGGVLRIAREQREWSLGATGLRVGLSKSVLGRLELGVRPLDMNRFVALCTVLEAPPDLVIKLAHDLAFPGCSDGAEVESP